MTAEDLIQKPCEEIKEENKMNCWYTRECCSCLLVKKKERKNYKREEALRFVFTDSVLHLVPFILDGFQRPFFF